MAEGLDLEVVKYADNSPILQLFLGKPLGVLSLLDEESKFQRATEDSLIGDYIEYLENNRVANFNISDYPWIIFADKLNQNLSENKYYYADKSAANKSFTVMHYNGKVSYNVNNFLKKNRNWHPPGKCTLKLEYKKN